MSIGWEGEASSQHSSNYATGGARWEAQVRVLGGKQNREGQEEELPEEGYGG